ncbi:MAG TPA: alpha/beta hydrolase [Gaiellales bacterium]|jgi:3-oxoadipate enol-lactonase|nr:alpha/beta hydrolase [Gaiellales bacterium]
MPTESVNGIDINYRLEGDGDRTLVLVNGLADDLESWALQMDDLLGAGYRVLRFDNRGVGSSSAPPSPYTTRLFAEDAKALIDRLDLGTVDMMGVSMGGMIAQEYALAYPGALRSVTFACTYAAPGPFCSRMFSMWADMAPVNGVPFIMRDVTLWAFTVPFFEEREEEAKEFEAEMAGMPMPVDAYLAQLSSIRTHDTRDRIGGLETPALVLAGEEDILIPVRLSRQLHDLIPGAEWATTRGGHACCWEHPAEFNQALLRFLSEH